MLKPKLSSGGAISLPNILICVLFSLVSAKVENSFQSSSQYSQYKDYYSSTPPSSYQFPDLTVKSSSVVGGDISSNPILGESYHHQPQDSVVAQGTVQQPVVHGSGANQHVYYYETYPTQDSSRGNGYGVPGAGGNRRCTYLGNGSMRCYQKQDSGGYGSNDYDTTGEDGSSGAGLGGLAGLVGLLGLKGLKGLASVVFPLILPLLLPLILPLALPILLPLLLLLLLPILLIPIPVISVPAPTVRRSLELGYSEARKMASGVFERVVSSDECVERISCEISKMSQKRKAGEWMEKVLRYLPESSPITKRIMKGFSMGNESSTATEGKSIEQTCSRMKCKMLSVFETPSG